MLQSITAYCTTGHGHWFLSPHHPMSTVQCDAHIDTTTGYMRIEILDRTKHLSKFIFQVWQHAYCIRFALMAMFCPSLCLPLHAKLFVRHACSLAASRATPAAGGRGWMTPSHDNAVHSSLPSEKHGCTEDPLFLLSSPCCLLFLTRISSCCPQVVCEDKEFLQSFIDHVEQQGRAFQSKDPGHEFKCTRDVSVLAVEDIAADPKLMLK